MSSLKGADMKITRTLMIDKPVEDVWDILANRYAEAGSWASAVYVSRPREGTPKVAEAPVLGRICETSLGPIVESIETFNAASRTLAYSATAENMPSFLTGLLNTWKLTAAGPNSTRVDMVLTANIAFPFNILMGWMMRLQFKGAIDSSLTELKYFAETGRPHPKKVKSAKSKKVQAILAANA